MKEVLKALERNLCENEVSAIDIPGRIELLSHHRPFSVKTRSISINTRSILCKIKSGKGILKALMSNLSAMDRKGRKDLP